MDVKTSREEFEAWVRNPHMLSRRTSPGSIREYEHPWTNGAWEAWQELYTRIMLSKGFKGHAWQEYTPSKVYYDTPVKCSVCGVTGRRPFGCISKSVELDDRFCEEKFEWCTPQQESE